MHSSNLTDVQSRYRGECSPSVEGVCVCVCVCLCVVRACLRAWANASPNPPPCPPNPSSMLHFGNLNFKVGFGNAFQ